MFYRFKSKFATQDRVQAYISLFSNADKIPWGPHPTVYEDVFTIATNQKTSSGLVEYLAPETDYFIDLPLQFNPGKETEIIPDLWGIENYLVCSQRFREVVSAIDPMQHQFTPLQVIDTQQQPVATAQPYYWLNLRRFIRVPISEQCNKNLPFVPSQDEEHLFYQIQQQPQLAERLSRIPIWRYVSEDAAQSRRNYERQIVYFNAAMLAAFQQAGLTGLDLYSVPGGRDEESVTNVISTEGAKP